MGRELKKKKIDRGRCASDVKSLSKKLEWKFFACDASLPKQNCLIPKAPNWFSIVAVSICKKVVRNGYSFKSTVMTSVVEFVHAFCMTVDLDLISISSFICELLVGCMDIAAKGMAAMENDMEQVPKAVLQALVSLLDVAVSMSATTYVHLWFL